MQEKSHAKVQNLPFAQANTGRTVKEDALPQQRDKSGVAPAFEDQRGINATKGKIIALDIVGFQ